MRISKNEDGEFLGLTSDYKNANEFKSIVALKFSITAPIAVNRVAWLKEVDGEWEASTNLDREAKQFYVGTVIQPKGKAKKKAKKVVKVEPITIQEDDVFTRPLILESDEAVDKLVEILQGEPEVTTIGENKFEYFDHDEHGLLGDDE